MNNIFYGPYSLSLLCTSCLLLKKFSGKLHKIEFVVPIKDKCDCVLCSDGSDKETVSWEDDDAPVSSAEWGSVPTTAPLFCVST